MTITISATASGSLTPPTAEGKSVVNGDFLILRNRLAPDEITGDGSEEETSWTFYFDEHPDFALFSPLQPLTSALLTLTLTPKDKEPGGIRGVTTDGFWIETLGYGGAPEEFQSLPLDETATITVELLDRVPSYTSTAILGILFSIDGLFGGRISMHYQDDAIVSFAQLELTQESFPLPLPMEETMNDTIAIPRTALVSILNSFIGSYPNPEGNPQPPGPWDPVIRKAFNQIRWQFGPHPEPWGTSVANLLNQVPLNPQPLPPRVAYTTVLAQEMVNNIANLQDIAEMLPEDAQARVGEIANRRLQLFFDDYCGTPPRKSPFPVPRPRDGVVEGFNPLELVIIGTQFEAAATTLVNGELQEALSGLGAKLVEQGISQL